MKILHISDTHQYHYLLDIPNDIDMIIHSGDCSNHRSVFLNHPEVLSFIDWYKGLPIKYKIYVAGNHDSSIEIKGISREDFKNNGIIYLEDELIDIEGLKIYGSPYTPSFGNWSFMKQRHKIHQVWDVIPKVTDVLVTHGPPKGVLDLSEFSGKLEMAGCSNLMKRVLEIKPKYHLFGHIHNNGDIINAGIKKFSKLNTIFSNGSVVTDGEFGKLSSNGNIFEI